MAVLTLEKVSRKWVLQKRKMESLNDKTAICLENITNQNVHLFNRAKKKKNEANPIELNIEVDKFTLTVGDFIFFLSVIGRTCRQKIKI